MLMAVRNAPAKRDAGVATSMVAAAQEERQLAASSSGWPGALKSSLNVPRGSSGIRGAKRVSRARLALSLLLTERGFGLVVKCVVVCVLHEGSVWTQCALHSDINAIRWLITFSVLLWACVLAWRGGRVYMFDVGICTLQHLQENIPSSGGTGGGKKCLQ